MCNLLAFNKQLPQYNNTRCADAYPHLVLNFACRRKQAIFMCLEMLQECFTDFNHCINVDVLSLQCKLRNKGVSLFDALIIT